MVNLGRVRIYRKRKRYVVASPPCLAHSRLITIIMMMIIDTYGHRNDKIMRQQTLTMA